ncbi:MAG: hypothetical protein AAF682_31845 [Planctomycetota bacterium]
MRRLRVLPLALLGLAACSDTEASERPASFAVGPRRPSPSAAPTPAEETVPADLPEERAEETPDQRTDREAGGALPRAPKERPRAMLLRGGPRWRPGERERSRVQL